MSNRDSKLIFEGYRDKVLLKEALNPAVVGAGAVSLIDILLSLGASLGITSLAGKTFTDLINQLRPQQLSEVEAYTLLGKNLDEAFKSQDLDRIKSSMDQALLSVYDANIPALNDIASVLMKGINAFYKSYASNTLEETGEEALGILAASVEASATALIDFLNSTIQIVQNSESISRNIKTSTITIAQQAMKSLDDIVVNAKRVRPNFLLPQRTKRKPKTKSKPTPKSQKPKGPQKDWLSIIGKVLRGSIDIVQQLFRDLKFLTGVFYVTVFIMLIVPIIYAARNGIEGINDLITGIRNLPTKASDLFSSLWGDDESDTPVAQPVAASTPAPVVTDNIKEFSISRDNEGKPVGNLKVGNTFKYDGDENLPAGTYRIVP